MKDVTFVIQTRIDSKERLANMDFCVKFIQRNFGSPVVIVEEDASPKVRGKYNNVTYVFIKTHPYLFNRTRLVNVGVRGYCKTEFVCLDDMDVFLDANFYVQARELLNTYSLVYPFDGTFYNIRHEYTTIANLKMSDVHASDMKLLNSDSVGGMQFIHREDFLKGGMTNELFLGWGYEDREFYARFEKLGYSIKKMSNAIYHFNHPRNYNSDGRSPYIKDNEAIYNSVCAMSKEELLRYIDENFYWCK